MKMLNLWGVSEVIAPMCGLACPRLPRATSWARMSRATSRCATTTVEGGTDGGDLGITRGEGSRFFQAVWGAHLQCHGTPSRDASR